jgi:hypothetical protein
MRSLQKALGIGLQAQRASLKAPLRPVAHHWAAGPPIRPACTSAARRRYVAASCTAAEGPPAPDDAAPAAPASPYLGQHLPGLTTEVPSTAYCIVNFYHLADVPEPQAAVERHRARLEGKDVRGRIYISTQGINSQFGGSSKDAIDYTLWVSQQPEFRGMRFSLWPASEHMFPKLRLKCKPNLISLAGGMTTLPITEPIGSRATPLQPEQWRAMLAAASQQREQAAEQAVRGAAAGAGRLLAAGCWPRGGRTAAGCGAGCRAAPGLRGRLAAPGRRRAWEEAQRWGVHPKQGPCRQPCSPSQSRPLPAKQ